MYATLKNTGRCAELLVPGAEVFIQRQDRPERKTKFDLITVRKGSRLINIDSAAPNSVFHEWVESGAFLPDVTLIRPEQRFGDSRLDFYLEAAGRRIYVEVKGVTLESGGVARFPDAPTLRGLKHLHELIACRDSGFEAWIVFIVQMSGISYLEPNWDTHPAFGEALGEAAQAGVNVLALGCDVTPDTLTAGSRVPVRIFRHSTNIL